MITIEDIQKLDLRIAKVLEVEEHPNADRLWKLKLQIGDEVRQIVAGIRNAYDKESLLGKSIILVYNLEPATIRGEESQGMLLAAKSGEDLTILTVDRPIDTGAKVS